MHVIMDIAGINSKVIVSIPDNEVVHPINEERAIKMAIETVCMIKKTDIDVEEVTREETSTLIKAAQALINYIEEEHITDEISTDGHYTDQWRSSRFQSLIDKVKKVL